MNIENLTTIEDLESFIRGKQAVAFTVLGDKHQRYKFIQKTLIKFGYITLTKPDEGIVSRYLRKITGYSHQQLTRLSTTPSLQLGSIQPEHKYIISYSTSKLT